MKNKIIKYWGLYHPIFLAFISFLTIHTGNVTDWTTEGQSETGIKEYERPTAIYVVS